MAEQQTFETAVASSASIVKPTVPKNVLLEFQHFAATGNRFGKQNPFDDEDEGGSAQYVAPPPQQQYVVRNRAPLPPMPQPPPQPVMVQQQQPQRPMDFREFGNFSISSSTTSQPMPSLINSRFFSLKKNRQQLLTVGCSPYGSHTEPCQYF